MQRPAEIGPTIISQCSTLFVLRLSNDRDQELIRSAVSDAAVNLLSFIPSLGTREVFTFGPRRRATDTHALPGIAARRAAEQRSLRQYALGRRHEHGPRPHLVCDRALAQRPHEPSQA